MAWGYPAAYIAQMRAAAGRPATEEDDVCDVMAENATAVRLFMALRTQWRITALSTMDRARLVSTGLDYGVIEPTARMAGLVLDDDDFARLRIMESEAIKAFGEEAKS